MSIMMRALVKAKATACASATARRSQVETGVAGMSGWRGVESGRRIIASGMNDGGANGKQIAQGNRLKLWGIPGRKRTSYLTY